MKRKNNYLIWCGLFIFLLLPTQFGCNKDKLQLQEEQQQTVIDDQGITDIPSLPETGPDGESIDPATIIYEDGTQLKGGLAIEKIVLTNKWCGVPNDVDSWDTKIYHEIHPYSGQSGNIWYLHYINVPEKGWIHSGWINANTTLPQTSYVSCDVSFHEGHSVGSYGYTYRDGVYTGKWGPTITVEDPDEANNSFEEFVLEEAINYVVDGLFCGFGIPYTQIAGWFSSGGLYDDAATILVVDQDGNPLHADIGSETSFLGSAVEDEDGSNTKGITCKEPNGPGSYDDNLYGRTAIVDISPYINEEYWGIREDEHMPVITVTFNINGTTTVDYP